MAKSTISKSKNVILRKKKITDGYSLYLDIHQDGKRHYEFLGLKISGNPRATKEDKFNLELAERIKSDRIIGISTKKYNAEDLKKKPTLFFDYYDSYYQKKFIKPNTIKRYVNTRKYIFKFFGENTSFDDFTVTNLEKFQTFLQQNLKKNTANTYYVTLKSVLNQAKKENFVSEIHIDKVKPIGTTKNLPKYLNLEELKQLINDKENWQNSYPKKAFLFACFTGLRYSDVKKLQRKHIQKIKEQYRLQWEQTKTKTEEYNPIPEVALNFINVDAKADDYLFPNLSIHNASNMNIKRWMMKLGIDKPVTFHSSRHTYATMLISSGVDLYTVSKLLGHSDIKVTQVYAKVVDQKKIEAVNSIPKFNV